MYVRSKLTSPSVKRLLSAETFERTALKREPVHPLFLGLLILSSPLHLLAGKKSRWAYISGNAPRDQNLIAKKGNENMTQRAPLQRSLVSSKKMETVGRSFDLLESSLKKYLSGLDFADRRSVAQSENYSFTGLTHKWKVAFFPHIKFHI